MTPENVILSENKKEITLDYGASSSIMSAEFLRVNSPSAEVKGHSPEQKKLVSGKKDVTVKSIELVGNYAIRLIFSDDHSTGIYTWRYLQDLFRGKDKVWKEYLSELEKKGLSR
tara:strand:- start:789 stop:1130 length:342 start_codon:yes stop_codon:yes gene_type:complete